MILLADQRRNSVGPGELAQGPDIIASISPAYGFGRRFELGVPIGVYAEEGLHSGGEPLLMPYTKLALLGADSKHHLSVSAQSAFWAFPANIGMRYGHDLGAWEPQVGASYILSGGPAGGDGSIVTRYQQANQSLLAGSIGATFNRPRRPAVEIGVLRNSYDQPSQTTSMRRTLYDLFVGFHIGVVK